MAEPFDPFSCPLHFVATHGNDSREARALRRAVEGGHMTRVSPGAYTPTSTWLSLDGRGRHVVLTRAVLAGLTAPSVVSHRSAVALHGLPQVSRQYEPLVEIIDERRRAVRRSRLLRRRPGLLGADDVTFVNGVPVTSIARTAVDTARTANFADAVLCVDAVLRRLVLPLGHRTGPAVDTLLARHRAALLDRVGPSHHPGGRAARRVIDFASPHAENGGESLLRVVLHELGAPTPELQRIFTRNGRFVARCDAYLAESGTVVEFDGFVKLTDPTMLAGKTPEEALRDRVRRDKRLLALPEVRHVVHCYYIELVKPRLLAALLDDADVALNPRRRAEATRIAARRFDGARG